MCNKLKHIKYIFRCPTTFTNYHLGWETKPSGKSVVHCENPMTGNHTLCGEAFDDEKCFNFYETKSKINCPVCINIITIIKGIKEKELC